MGETESDKSVDEQLPEPELRHPGVEPSQERALSRSREPESSDDEESEDNDGGPPSSRR
jgi:hypothetical protein